MARKPVAVTILDHTFQISTDNSEERVKEIADFVNHSLKEALSKGKGLSAYHAAVLTALNLADKYFAAMDEQKALKSQVKEKSKKILGLLESAAPSA